MSMMTTFNIALLNIRGQWDNQVEIYNSYQAIGLEFKYAKSKAPIFIQTDNY